MHRARLRPAGRRATDYLDAFQPCLPDDLAAIGEESACTSAPRSPTCAPPPGIADPLELQKLYAALFLTPPTPVMVNTGCYIDGGIMGVSRPLGRRLCRATASKRHEHFRDLNDTVGVQAEFLAMLFERAASQRRWRARISRPAPTWPRPREPVRLCLSLDHAFPARPGATSRDHDVNPVYAHLARLIWLAVGRGHAGPRTAPMKAGMDSLPPGRRAGSAR